MIKNRQKTWGKGTIRIYDIELDCYILMDGTPILSKNKLNKALGKTRKQSRTNKPSFVGAINLQPFIRDELEEKLIGIEFYDSGRLIKGYDADILPLICNVYLEARQARDILAPSQLPIAEKCEILLRSFARVGIRALIYEQLGYERFKHPDAFRLLIESYLSEELRKWSKEFPDELFFQMDRIYGNQKTTSKNRPLYYAKFLRKFIYEPIQQGFVLNRLDEKNPTIKPGYRKERHHQHLSEDIGINALRSQIWQVIGLLKSSANKRKFEDGYERMMGNTYQLELWGNLNDEKNN